MKSYIKTNVQTQGKLVNAYKILHNIPTLIQFII